MGGHGHDVSQSNDKPWVDMVMMSPNRMAHGHDVSQSKVKKYDGPNNGVFSPALTPNVGPIPTQNRPNTDPILDPIMDPQTNTPTTQ